MTEPFPVRVAVISRSQVVRAGLVALIAQLQARAFVTDAVSIDGHLTDYDVALYDLSAISDDGSAQRDLRALLAAGTEIIGVVYARQDTLHAVVAEDELELVDLTVTPEQMMTALRASVVRRAQVHAARSKSLPSDLSEQEFRVLELIGAGMSNEAIAKELVVSINTVKTYIRVAYRKLDLTDRSSAMLWALDHGLAGGPDQR